MVDIFSSDDFWYCCAGVIPRSSPTPVLPFFFSASIMSLVRRYSCSAMDMLGSVAYAF